jgi:hypothetical protein
VKDSHLTRLTTYFHELADCQGVLQTHCQETPSEQAGDEYLVRLAFKFYRQLHETSPRNAIEACRTCMLPCPGTPDACIRSLRGPVSLPCLNCGQVFLFPEAGDDEDVLPICPDCIKIIERDIEMWEMVSESSNKDC